MNQGRSKKQIEGNYKMTFWSLVGLVLIWIIIILN